MRMGGGWRMTSGWGANQKIIHIELPQQPQQKHTNSNEKLSNESALQFQICSANYYKSFVCWTTYSYSNLHTHTHTYRDSHWVWHTNATIIPVTVPPAHTHKHKDRQTQTGVTQIVCNSLPVTDTQTCRYIQKYIAAQPSFLSVIEFFIPCAHQVLKRG